MTETTLHPAPKFVDDSKFPYSNTAPQLCDSCKTDLFQNEDGYVLADIHNVFIEYEVAMDTGWYYKYCKPCYSKVLLNKE